LTEPSTTPIREYSRIEDVFDATPITGSPQVGATIQ
jgi:hypothetical protein